MTLDTAMDAPAALRAPQALSGASLRLLPPVSREWLLDEADMEAIAFMDETAGAMDRILTAEIGRDVPSLIVINEAGRVAYRAGLAKAEVLRLRGGNDAA